MVIALRWNHAGGAGGEAGPGGFVNRDGWVDAYINRLIRRYSKYILIER